MRLDVYEAKFGDRIDVFMESQLRSADHVPVVCKPNYNEKSAMERGGVGHEKAIIKKLIDDDDRNRRIIPVLRQGTKTDVPAFFGSALFADMRSDDDVEPLLDELALLFYGKPRCKKPELGPPPY